jgi:hypothetical protein
MGTGKNRDASICDHLGMIELLSLFLLSFPKKVRKQKGQWKKERAFLKLFRDLGSLIRDEQLLMDGTPNHTVLLHRTIW